MHLVITVISLAAVCKWADWKHWKNYHPTLLYIAIGNLMYTFLTADYWLWRIQPDFLMNYVTVEVIYTLIIFPSSAFLFLSSYPEGQPVYKQVLHILKWVLIYVFVEWIGYHQNLISYQLGWSLLWSALFDGIMFPMLRLHYKKPVVAYSLSVFFAVSFLLLFGIPLSDRK